MEDIRRPAVAGQFYEFFKEDLLSQIKDCFLNEFGPKKLPKVNPKGSRNIIGLVSPHAGYIYSGPIAAHGFYQLASDGIPDTFIILSPNHTGFGTSVSLMDRGKWETPLGSVAIGNELADKILKNSKIIKRDKAAHLYEHSIEVQLPFLQYIYDKFKFVPICMLDQSLEACEDIGNAIATSIKGKNAVIIASTDFTHFEPYDTACEKDKKAISPVTKLNPEELLETVDYHDISMCGKGPVTAMLIAAKKLGANSCELLKYATSGDTSGNKSQVVGYASMVIKKK